MVVFRGNKSSRLSEASSNLDLAAPAAAAQPLVEDVGDAGEVVDIDDDVTPRSSHSRNATENQTESNSKSVIPKTST